MNYNEKLLAAVGEIDDSLIVEAERYRPRYRENFRRALTTAACLLIVSAGIVGAVRLFPRYLDFEPKGDAPTSDKFPFNDGSTEDYVEGVTTTMKKLEFGTAEIKARTETHYTLYIELYRSISRQDVIFRGRGTDEFGEPIFIISTTADYAELTHIPVAPPIIKVNGESAVSLPTEAGSYTVEIDVSHLIDAGYELDDYFVLGDFGKFSR